ncbi:hypothetical protein Q4512_14565 [Oceanihabitans sp. 2_MG-2023]|uniref:hypothetical protein n=1 Tax=Oceanihabitans sp. 2_MG-2023 TaxID=3062661 RepID=UPI0026E15235|nr:hypothetical protein [Oceanihabitans sp. 2_MG-2023]MDO6598143.1 hypothetical protein [Oceanihabitans sp. 2_MG-2023]
MSVFESINNTSEKATDLGEKYIKTSHDYIKLKTFQQLTFSISLVVKLFAVGSLVFLGLVFLAISGAIAIGNALGSFTLGCFIVALIFIALAVLIYVFRKYIDQKIIKKVSIKFFN